MATTPSPEMLPESERKECVEVGRAFDVDIATFPTVPTGGSSSGDVLFTPEGYATVSTIAGFNEDLRSVDKHLARWW